MGDQDCFYETGLRFSCTRCSRCCRHTPGYVFLSPRDLRMLGAALGIERDELMRSYCREVPLGVATRVSLKEKPNLDCVFWGNDGCSVYEARPLQCRSFPFWASALSSRAEWEQTAERCPGIGRGQLHSREEIERWVTLRLREGFLEG
jgi:Fe-S-cluster containining protein